MFFLSKKSETGENNFSKNKTFKWLRIIVASFFILILILIFLYLIFEENYKNRIYPGVNLAGTDLGGLNRAEAREKIEEKIRKIEQEGVKFTYKDYQTTITPIISSLEGDFAYQIILFDKEKIIENTFYFGRSNGLVKDIKNKILSLKNGYNTIADVKIETEEIKKILNENFKQFEQTGQDARLIATSSKNWARRIDFSIEEEKIGYKPDFYKAINNLQNNLSRLDNSAIEIIITEDYPEIYKKDCLNAEKEAQAILTLAPFNFIYEDKKWEIKKEILSEWLKLKKEINNKIIIDLDEFIAPEINKEAVDARFEIKDSKVIEFSASNDGVKISNGETISTLKKQLFSTTDLATTTENEGGEPKQKEIEIITAIQKSHINTGDINDLGIKEIIGTGHSNFVGSPNNRIHNITTGAKSLAGILIKPDEEFSLVNALGDINKESGYLPELVIRGNKTIPEYGGGLCQIGTTIFRTALETGLPITHRRNHSYRVSYYEPAGTDAAIYDPWPDLRFINDTGNYILILYRIDGNDLYFDFWGTKDGRQIEKTDPTIYNIVKPGPTKLIETTDLKPGVKRCTESAHNGADTYFDYKVTYPNEEIKEERFSSHYIPWQAVCLIGVEKLSVETSTSSEEKIINE